LEPFYRLLDYVLVIRMNEPEIGLSVKLGKAVAEKLCPSRVQPSEAAVKTGHRQKDTGMREEAIEIFFGAAGGRLQVLGFSGAGPGFGRRHGSLNLAGLGVEIANQRRDSRT
jgi:hypothetical protein